MKDKLDKPGPIADGRTAIEAAEHSLAKAHVQMDVDAIDHLLHADYIIVQPGGKIETKAEVLASYRTEKRQWEMARVDQLDIGVQGSTAIVVGRWRASGRHGDERFDYTARFLSVWIEQNGHWQNIAYQSTEIARQ